MLLRLTRIKNLGVFGDYSWDGKLPSFQRYNVIYGENGSGKTTLSRLMNCLRTGEHTDFPALEYKVSSQTGDLQQKAPSTKKIRVFNSDYVQQNIGQLESVLKPILIIGEENRAVAAEIEAQEASLVVREKSVDEARARIEALEVDRGKIFTRIASQISTAIIGSTARTYRKGEAQVAFEKLGDAAQPTDDELNICEATLKQEVMDKVAEGRFELDESGEMSISQAISNVLSRAASICGETALSVVARDLAERPQVVSWVEAGHALHKEIGHEDCAFCNQNLPAARWNELENHFSSADRDLKEKLGQLITEANLLSAAFAGATLPNRMALYSEMRDSYDEATQRLENASSELIGGLRKVSDILSGKQSLRSDKALFDVVIDTKPVEAALANANQIIEKHNAKSAGFDEARSAARTTVETHYLLSIRDEVAEFDQKIEGEKAKLLAALNGPPSIKELAETIKTKKAQLSNEHKAGEELTKLLHTFLGRDELVFESNQEGYRVCRNGKPARKLSEGERTAVAFIYFIVQLRDQEFKLDEGIVVIDDPVSSLDSNSVYQAFAFLKNAVDEAKQVFLLTHNFGFLRLVLNWFTYKDKRLKQNGYYMLVCRSNDNGRQSNIAPLDRALIDYPTEYHFLFKVLATFENDGTIAGCYHIPNVARKVLEAFLDFYIPGSASVYTKLVEEVDFDKNKRVAIYKYTNDLSHRTGQGFEPGLVAESQKNVGYLLEMIKAVAPKHYEGMIASIK